MDQTAQTQIPPSSPVVPPVVPPASVPPQPSQSGKGSGPLRSPFIYMLLLFLFGIGLGYLLTKEFPKNKTSEAVDNEVTTAALSVPKEAVKVETDCAKDITLFVKPSDIPKGPIYILDQGKLIGLEYVLNKEEFDKGTTYSDLKAMNIQLDHMSVRNIDKGYDGKEGPFYLVDLFLVPKEKEKTISCSAPVPTASASAEASTSPEVSSASLPSLTPGPTLLKQKQ